MKLNYTIFICFAESDAHATEIADKLDAELYASANIDDFDVIQINPLDNFKPVNIDVELNLLKKSTEYWTEEIPENKITMFS